MIGVAIVRGKGIPAVVYSHELYESKAEFMARVIELCSDPQELRQRNTLTFEFVWNSN